LDVENHPPAELTVVIADDGVLRELNRAFRGMDAPTDVLSFGGEAPGFVVAPDAADYLGDVVISYPHAQAQATGHSVEAELALLVIHGVLHLLGYDHLEPDEKEAMWRQQATALEKLGLIIGC
jgi:probable rRNA maturation factor